MYIGSKNALGHSFNVQKNSNVLSKNLNQESRVDNNLNFYSKNTNVNFSPDEIFNYYSKLGDFQKSFIKSNSNSKSANTIPEGYSRYEYKGGRFDVYRHKDKYKTQFNYPEGFDKNEFFDNFPYLNPVVIEGDSNTSKDSVSNINGLIDEDTIQGSTGDCWLISSLYSMASTEKGAEIIKNSITVNDDSSVTVAFKGIGVSYTISKSELERYDTDNNIQDDYSNGDNDVLVIELAVEKLWQDIESGKVVLDTNNEEISYSGDGMGIGNGGLLNQLQYYLCGVESEEYYNDDLSNISKEKIYEILQNAYESDNTSLAFGLYGNNHSALLTDGTYYDVNLDDGGHGYAITEINENTVTFVNPWNTSDKYTVSWEEFANLGIGYITVSDLNNSLLKDEITDMTSSDADSFNKQGRYDYLNYFDEMNNFNFDYVDNQRHGYNFYNNGFNQQMDLNSMMELLEFLINSAKSM